MHHQSEVGRCRRGVCAAKLRPPVLKRKKRFVCLIALASLIRAKKERRRLQEQMDTLRRLHWVNSVGRANSLTGRGVGNTNFPRTRPVGSGVAGATTGAENAIEIHLIQGGGNGDNVVGNSGSRNTHPFISGSAVGGSRDSVDIRGGVPGSPGVINDGGRRGSLGTSAFGNNRSGASGRVDSTVDSSVGVGSYSSRAGGAGNVGFGNSAGGGSLDGNTGVDAGIVGGGITGNVGGITNGGSVTRVSVSNIAATESGRTGAGSGSAAVVGILGATRTSRGNGIGTNGGGDRFGNAGPDMTSGGIIGVGGMVSTGGVRGRHNGNIGTGAIGASYLGGERSGSSGIGGGSRSISRAGGSFSEGAAAGRGGRAGGSGFVPGNGIFADEDGDELGPNTEDNEGSSLGETDVGYRNALEVRRGFDTGFRG